MVTRFKNKRAVTVLIGISGTAGADAYDSAGALQGTSVEFAVSALMPGEFSVSKPGETFTDPLVRGQLPTDGAPLKNDDQPMSGSFPLYKKQATSATAALIQDLFNRTGFFETQVTANTYESTVDSAEFFHFDLKKVETNPADATDTHFEIYRQSFLTSIEDAVGDPNQQTISWTCRKVHLTDSDMG